jgi:hypothetical protein
VNRCGFLLKNSTQLPETGFCSLAGSEGLSAGLSTATAGPFTKPAKA